MIHRRRFFLLYTRGFNELFRLLLLLCLLIALIEAYIALLFRILFLHFVQLGFARLESLKLKAEHIANERLHVDFHLEKRHLETFWCQTCQCMLYNLDGRRLQGFLGQDTRRGSCNNFCGMLRPLDQVPIVPILVLRAINWVILEDIVAHTFLLLGQQT